MFLLTVTIKQVTLLLCVTGDKLNVELSGCFLQSRLPRILVSLEQPQISLSNETFNHTPLYSGLEIPTEGLSPIIFFPLPSLPLPSPLTPSPPHPDCAFFLPFLPSLPPYFLPFSL